MPVVARTVRSRRPPVVRPSSVYAELVRGLLPPNPMQRILVTGGAGFIGSHLCERLLREGHEVVAVDNFFTGDRRNVAHLCRDPRFDVIRHDVTERRAFEVDRIFHLACPASPVHYQRNPVRTICTAVQGTLNVLELAREVGARVLLASTSEIYGDPLQHPQPESYWGNVNPVGARACYDEGKRCAEALAVAYTSQHGVESRIARVFNTYGPRMHPEDGRVVSNFVVQALRGAPLTIYGDGRQTRSFCFVDDLVEGLVRLMACEQDPGPINLGNPHEMTVVDLAEMIISLSGSRSRLSRRPLPSDDPARRRPDIARARTVLDWEPTVGVEDGLAATIEYFRGVEGVLPLPWPAALGGVRS
jgi:UDP-glucuronate decarboxylase